MAHVHRLDANRHHAFLAQKKKDTLVNQLLCAGDEIVICANCHGRPAFLAANWNGRCPRCNGSETLREIPTAESSLDFRRHRSPQRDRPFRTPPPAQVRPRRRPIGRYIFALLVIALIIGGGIWLTSENTSQSTRNPAQKDETPRMSMPVVPSVQELNIQADPWAEIFLDGTSQGYTPTTLKDVQIGSTIMLEYKDKKATYRLEQGQSSITHSFF